MTNEHTHDTHVDARRQRRPLAAEIRGERWCRERTRRWLDRAGRAYFDRIDALRPCPRWHCRCEDCAA